MRPPDSPGGSYVLIFGLAIFAGFAVLEGLVVDGDATRTVANLTGSLGMFRLGVVAFLIIALLDAAWLIGLAVFGLHLVLLGVLLMRSRLVPRVLGALLVAGAAYVAETLAHALLPDYSAVANVLLVAVALPSMIAEGWLGLWLLLTRRLPTTHVVTGA